jgi:hypothetical protein
MRQSCLLSPVLFDIVLQLLNKAPRQEKVKRMQIVKENV